MRDDNYNYEEEKLQLLKQIKLNGCGLDTASEELKNDKEISLEAISQKGS